MPSIDPVSSITNCYRLIVSVLLTQYTASSSRNAELSQLDLVFVSLLTSFLHTDQLGCQEGSPLGSDYKGNASITVSGRTCQMWSVQTPHTHGWTDQGDHNYCRNPDREAGAWCYTTDPDVRWELCLVPECDSLPQTGLTFYQNWN